MIQIYPKLRRQKRVLSKTVNDKGEYPLNVVVKEDRAEKKIEQLLRVGEPVGRIYRSCATIILTTRCSLVFFSIINKYLFIILNKSTIEAISLSRVVVAFPKININLPRIYDKLHCNWYPHRFRDYNDPFVKADTQK